MEPAAREEGDGGARPVHAFDDAEVIQVSSTWLPRQMQVRQASSLRGDIPARVCILGSDDTYRVFEIPQRWT